MFSKVQGLMSKKKKKDEPTDIRVIATSQGEGPVDMPAPEVLHAHFTDLLNELAVPEAKKTEMLAWPDDRKWILVSQHMDKIKEEEKKKATGGKLLDTPQYFMGVLKSSTPTSTTLKALRVSLNSQGVSWTQEFLELGDWIRSCKRSSVSTIKACLRRTPRCKTSAFIH